MPTPASDYEYDSPAVWDTARAVITRYRRVDGGMGIARDMDGAKTVDLLVLSWSYQGAPDGGIHGCLHQFSISVIGRRCASCKDHLGRQLGLLRNWRRVERALKTKEKTWIQG
ncbi:hypothetical protein EMCG_06434 [[Emmonsia] crescens]|uniref:Uncharacterized protein n=1 Tax=[Emmonsia] crescens TaxID=73230 RepID=A0A0G2ICB8_9EURO|nr:hypothetical protein EMCG_06434 [Emmonsia crescens UAMH 3008]